MEIQSRHSELSVISQVSVVEGYPLSGVPLYELHFIYAWLELRIFISLVKLHSAGHLSGMAVVEWLDKLWALVTLMEWRGTMSFLRGADSEPLTHNVFIDSLSPSPTSILIVEAIPLYRPCHPEICDIPYSGETLTRFIIGRYSKFGIDRRIKNLPIELNTCVPMAVGI